MKVSYGINNRAGAFHEGLRQVLMVEYYLPLASVVDPPVRITKT